MRRLLEAFGAALAVAGGVVLAGVALVATGSVLARWWFSAPLLGDVELVQIGCAVAIALFLPWCQLRRGHIVVDFFTMRARARTRDRLDAIGALLLALVFLVLAWRAAVGVLDMREREDISMLLAFPTWITYLAMVPGLALSGLVGLHDAWRHWRGEST